MRRPSWLAGPPHPEGDACVAPTACLIVCVKMNHRILVGPHRQMTFWDKQEVLDTLLEHGNKRR